MQAAWAVIPRGATIPQVSALTFGLAMNNPPSSTANIPKNSRLKTPPDARLALPVPRLILKSSGEPFPSTMVPLPPTTMATRAVTRPPGFITIPTIRSEDPTELLVSEQNSLTILDLKLSSGPRATRSAAASMPSSTTPSTARSPKVLAESDAAPLRWPS